MNDWQDAESRVERALQLSEAQQWDEALHELEAAIAINPNDPIWHAQRGQILDQLENFDFARWDPVPVGSFPAGAGPSAWRSFRRATREEPDAADTQHSRDLRAHGFGGLRLFDQISDELPRRADREDQA